MLSRIKLTNAHTVRGRPTLSVSIMAWSANSKKSKDHGPHRRNDKSECQEHTCKIDKSLNRRMCIGFESRKICVAGNI